MSRVRRSGLTLVEIMISMAVLAFVLLAFMSIMSSASSLSTSTREGLLANYDLQSAIEDTLAIPYSTFTAKFVNGPTYAGLDANGVNNAPTSTVSPHPLTQYWCYTNHPRPLNNEQMWFELLTQTSVSTSYKIHIKWKTHKGMYQEDWAVMQRATR